MVWNDTIEAIKMFLGSDYHDGTEIEFRLKRGDDEIMIDLTDSFVYSEGECVVLFFKESE